MPRVRMAWKDYNKQKIKVFVKSNLCSHGMKQKELAEKMDIEPKNFSAKVKDGRFSYIDLVEMFDIFETPDNERLELMTPEVRR